MFGTESELRQCRVGVGLSVCGSSGFSFSWRCHKILGKQRRSGNTNDVGYEIGATHVRLHPAGLIQWIFCKNIGVTVPVQGGKVWEQPNSNQQPKQSINNTFHYHNIIFFSSCCSHYPPSICLSRNFLRKNLNVPSAWNPAPTRSSTRNAITASVVNA